MLTNWFSSFSTVTISEMVACPKLASQERNGTDWAKRTLKQLQIGLTAEKVKKNYAKHDLF